MTSKKSVEAVLIGGALVVTLGGMMVPLEANAANLCSNTASGQGSTVTGDTASFVKVTFAAKCSPNTVVQFVQSDAAAAAKGASPKGNTVYGSSSEGGGGAKVCSTYTSFSAPADPAAATDGCS